MKLYALKTTKTPYYTGKKSYGQGTILGRGATVQFLLNGYRTHPPEKVKFLAKVKFITENYKRLIFCVFTPFLNVGIYLRMAFTSQKMARFNLSRPTLKKLNLTYLAVLSVFDQFGGRKSRFLDFFKVLLELSTSYDKPRRKGTLRANLKIFSIQLWGRP